MAAIQAHSLPSHFGALRSDNKSQLTTCTPYSSPVKQRGSSCYLPQRGTRVLEESNTDPFYLEQTLRDSCKPGQRDVRCCETTDHQYFTLSSVNKRKEYPYPNPVRREPAGPRSNIYDNAKGNRSTLSVVELEHRIGLQQIAAQRGLEKQHVHCKQDSFSSSTSEVTPDLTPSSSFSSNYSLVRDQHLSFEPQRITSESGSHLYLTPCTPPPIRPPPPTTLPSLPSTPRPHQTPTSKSKGTARPVNDSTETLTMQNEDPQLRYNRLGKPLPTLPNIARNGPKSKTAQNGTQRSQIEPSMISPPSLINPVTMEPHSTHFDQAFFIPANDCPSPVPSPGRNSTSSRLAREVTNTPPSREKERPWTARPEAYCEQSVWESDSDSESIGPKSLSKKPIDTLRKVRSRVHLRVARSAPRLNGAPPLPPPVPSPPTDGAPLEKFPSMPDHPIQQPPHPPPPPLPPGSSKKPSLQTRSSKDIPRPNTQTLRLVAPSTTSLVLPESRKDKDKEKGSLPATPTTTTTKTSEHDMDYAAAAAFQAQSRRRQRSRSPTSPAATGYADKEKLRTLCREERTEHTLNSSLTLGRRPLYRRFWESLRILSCHNDMAPQPTRKSF
ncbi:uncharacterized protein EURHEDRAFT_401748 [Aspergillus ruber CBS 135680]|uniref:Uncharacterized protein n=1 Tax=Aspergillus ruber (strain CBS 135680) TaxID=1388766 RepID=A0A017SGN5_ASPRC|nr:uncharacterized protein EURHEDRAFT_401748 [Aspergillus ruber CBS 135680]EYE96092.1 hypothetical protein EURHEDRAFT_401748 [Aspergillus ruber CBS 135680]